MEAEVLMHRVREATVRTLGAEHPDTLTAISNLALLLDMKNEQPKPNNFTAACSKRASVCWARTIPTRS